MLRINLLVAVAVATGVVGCAQCDTCDDFPAPCTGPNCGQAYGIPGDAMAPSMRQGPPAMAPTGPTSRPTSDDAGPAPATPSTPTTTPPTPSPDTTDTPDSPEAPEPASPPRPMEPDTQPK